jgi:hypothetical protein
VAKTFTEAYNDDTTAADSLTGNEIIGYDPPAPATVSKGSRLIQLKDWLATYFSINGHTHSTEDISGINNYMQKPAGAVEGNLAEFDANRNVIDSGLPTANVATTTDIAPLLIQRNFIPSTSVGTGSQITQSLAGTVERIEIAFWKTQPSTNNLLGLQLGTGGILTTSGYVTKVTEVNNSFNTRGPTGLVPLAYGQGNRIYGQVTAIRVGGDAADNGWVIDGFSYDDNGNDHNVYNAYIDLAGPCDICGLVANTTTFAQGHWQVTYCRSA